jgi:hypothetical protein
MVAKLGVFEYLLHELGDKQAVAFSTFAKQHKISFFIDLLAILK